MISSIKNKLFILIFILVAYHLFFFWYTNIYSVRPYHYTLFTDVEIDYFFNIKLLYNNFDIISVYHPGSLIYLIGNIIMQFTSDNLDKIQQFFFINYLVIVITNLLSLIYFIFFFKKENVNFIYLNLFVITIIVYPSYNVYLERLSADSYIPAISLIISVFFWKLINYDFNKKNFFLLGLFCGLGLSIKLSLLPLIVLIYFYFLLFGFHRKENIPKFKNFLNFIYLNIITGLSFFIFFLPSFTFLNFKKLILLIFNTIFQNSSHSSLNFLDIKNLIWSSKSFSLLLFMIIILFSLNINKIRFDKKCLYLLFSSILLLIVYFSKINFERINYLNDLIYEYQFRQGIALIPFLFITFLYIEKKIGLNKRLVDSKILLIILYSLIFLNFFEYSFNRKALLNDHETKRNEFKNELVTINSDKIALWMEHPETYKHHTFELGAVSFLHWGNFKFAKKKFDDYIEKKFPDYRFLSFEYDYKLRKFFDYKINDEDKISVILLSKNHLYTKFKLTIGDFEKFLIKRNFNYKIIDKKFYYLVFINDLVVN